MRLCEQQLVSKSRLTSQGSRSNSSFETTNTSTMLKLTSVCSSHVAKLVAASGTQLQATRHILGGADHNKSEPTASPWVKVLERPGDDTANRSEQVDIENPYKNKDRKDVDDDVPEKNPDRQPQAQIDPEVLAAADANKHSDSMRIMADKLNQAVGGDADFPETGGTTIRDMASEIGHNIGEKLGMNESSDSTVNRAEQAASRASDSVADTVNKAKEAVTGSKSA